MTVKRLSIFGTAGAFICFGVAACVNDRETEESWTQPALIIVIVIDQLRPVQFDWLKRVRPGGGLALLHSGIVYERAFFQHAVTQTGPGHASIATGAHPSSHGIVANKWFERKVEPVERDGDLQNENQFGTPTTVTFASSLETTTFGDSLIWATDGRARVVAVSGKKRSAVLLGGLAGTAYWFDDVAFVGQSGQRAVNPDWLKEKNHEIRSLLPIEWSLSEPRTKYHSRDDRVYEIPPGEFENVFPHSIIDGTAFAHSPFLDKAVLDIAKTVITTEAMGVGASPDLLFLSLSATDRMGHYFGPQSLEMEDHLYRLDHYLDDFFAWLDEAIGLQSTLVVLTADHGADLIPESARPAGIPAHRLDMTAELEHCNDAVRAVLNLQEPVAGQFLAPYVYLFSYELSGNAAAHQRLVDRYANCLVAQPGIENAYVTDDLLANKPINRDTIVANSVHPKRGGDIYVVQSEHTYMHHDLRAATHGSPYGYDRHVPIAFYMQGMCAGKVWREVGPESIASTLAHLLSIPAPPYSENTVLWEAIESMQGTCAAQNDAG